MVSAIVEEQDQMHFVRIPRDPETKWNKDTWPQSAMGRMPLARPAVSPRVSRIVCRKLLTWMFHWWRRAPWQDVSCGQQVKGLIYGLQHVYFQFQIKVRPWSHVFDLFLFNSLWNQRWGLDSLAAVQLRNNLQQQSGISLPSTLEGWSIGSNKFVHVAGTLMFDYPTMQVQFWNNSRWCNKSIAINFQQGSWFFASDLKSFDSNSEEWSEHAGDGRVYFRVCWSFAGRSPALFNVFSTKVSVTMPQKDFFAFGASKADPCSIN